MLGYNEEKIKEILKWDWLLENGYTDESEFESIDVVDNGNGLIVRAVKKNRM